jgi:hypothetical protein
MVLAQYKVFVDWNADGDFTDPREDVTSDVLDGRTPLSMRYGRNQARQLSPIDSGDAALALDNQSRLYSPENTSSALYGQVIPGRKVMVTARQTSTGVTTTMLRAQLDDSNPQPDREQRYLAMTCIDPLGTLKGVSVSTGLYRGLRTGEAVALLLDAAGWPLTLRDIEVGATVMPYWWLDNEDAFDALLDLVYSEGPPALVTVDTQGRIVFRSRHHRLQSAASTTVQSTWRSSGIEPMVSAPASYNDGWKEIVNTVNFSVPQRVLSGDVTAVWSSQGQLGIASGETISVIAQGNNPFMNAVVPVAGTDFTLVSGTVIVTISKTSGLSTTIGIQAISGPAVIADLSLRAQSVDTVSTVQLSAVDGASVIKYGPRALPDSRDPKWASIGDAQAIQNIILTQRGDRLPTITVSMVSANNTRLTQQLTRNLSDRVHMVESHTGLDADCFIEQISHTITQGGAEHRTTFGLEKAPTQILGAFVLGTGVLGTNRLGRRASADPSTMFVLGSATNGVLGTNVLVP